MLGDADRLRQLLLNLVDNAIKYTPAGGPVTLTLQKENSWVQVAVRIPASAFAEEDLPHIFERFYRADPQPRAGRAVQGLACRIAHWIAEAHGGRLDGREPFPDTAAHSALWLPLADTRREPGHR